MRFDESVQEQLVQRGYTIVKRAGQGAFGILYEIKNVDGDRLALKVLAIPEQDKYAVVSAVKSLGVEGILEREKIAMGFHHPHIIHISESFGITLQSVQVPCIVEEWINGQSLEETVMQASLSRKEQHALLEGIASAVGYIHEQGCVHRDIKPANIIDGLLLDFSIAERIDKNSRIINPHPAQQSASYAAPETKANNNNYDARRADVWSFGLLMCEVFAKRKVTSDIKDQDLSFILDNLVPHQYKSIIRKCLSKDPRKRYADGAELYKALRKAGNYYQRLAGRSIFAAGLIASSAMWGVVQYQKDREAQAAVYAQECSAAVESSPSFAEKLCRDALALDERVDALLFLGDALVMQGKTAVAAEMYEKAYVRNPDVLNQLRTRAKTASSPIVPVLLDFVYQKTQDAQDGLALVHAYIADNQFENAAKMLHQKSWKVSTAESLAVAGYYEEHSNWQEVLFFLDYSLKITQDQNQKAELLMRKGDVFCKDNQFSAAIESYKAANRINPNPEIFVRIAELWHSAGKDAAARGALDEAESMYARLLVQEKRKQDIISEKSGYADTTNIDALTGYLTDVRRLQREY
jgi:tetratricopeptide (TPR) repeat protein